MLIQIVRLVVFAFEAGQQLGHARMESDTGVAYDFDIAIHVHTADGFTFLALMTSNHDVSRYSQYGSYPDDFIITEAQRNSDRQPKWKTFTTKGSLPSWIFGYLISKHVPTLQKCIKSRYFLCTFWVKIQPKEIIEMNLG